MVMVICGRGYIWSWLYMVVVIYGHGYIWSWLHTVVVIYDRGYIWSWLYMVMVIYGRGYIWSWLYMVAVIYGRGYIWSWLYMVVVIYGHGYIWSIWLCMIRQLGIYSIITHQLLISHPISNHSFQHIILLLPTHSGLTNHIHHIVNYACLTNHIHNIVNYACLTNHPIVPHTLLTIRHIIYYGCSPFILLSPKHIPHWLPCILLITTYCQITICYKYRVKDTCRRSPYIANHTSY